MKYYQDITFLHSEEVSLGFLWHKVYQQIHIALADNKQADGTSAIAVSFPEYYKADDREDNSRIDFFPLGKKLRLLANDKQQLEILNAEKWLSRLMDYCYLESIREIGEVKGYVLFKRQHAKSKQKKISSLAKHLNKTEKEIRQYRRKNNIDYGCSLPYIHMQSQQETTSGSKNRFRLFIKQQFYDTPQSGTFDCYGLSKTATVPWF